MENKIEAGSRCVQFSDFIDISFDKYAHYKKANTKIEGYERSAFFKISVISGLVELYRRDN